MTDVKRKEPATAATVTDSGGKVNDIITPIQADYSIKDDECQENFCELKWGVLEVAGIADDIHTLLEDTLHYFDFTAERYLKHPEEGTKWFEDYYDVLAAKIRLTCNRIGDICSMLNEIIRKDKYYVDKN